MNKMSPLRNLAIATLALCVAAACSSTRTQKSPGEVIDDAVIATKVKTELIDNPATRARDIDVAVFKGRVQLNGFVDSRDEAARAAQVARQVKGVTAVDNNLKMKGESRDAGDVIDDGTLSVQVKAALAGDPRTKAYQVEVNTRNSVVQLAGFVDNAAARAAAAELAGAVKGVARVDNQIAVK